MEEANVIGIDLAKNTFQVHGAKADGSVAHRKKLSRAKLLGFLPARPRCVGGDGSVRQPPLLGPGDRGARPRGAVGSAGLRQAVREETQGTTPTGLIGRGAWNSTGRRHAQTPAITQTRRNRIGQRSHAPAAGVASTRSPCRHFDKKLIYLDPEQGHPAVADCEAADGGG